MEFFKGGGKGGTPICQNDYFFEKNIMGGKKP